jgi:tRNA (guanine37-N1)-methyltransferase
MKITYISIFPEIFESFLATSLIAKAQKKKLLSFSIINPRDFCPDKHKQVDDEIYGWGSWMLMKAQPLIDAVESVIKKSRLKSSKKSFAIIFLHPSKTIFNQEIAHTFTTYHHIILVSARYEGVDYRFEQYMQDHYPKHFHKISIGKYITLGGEIPAMVLTESIIRLIPGVIKEENSRKDESYNPEKNMDNLEYPQYTRPENVEWYTVPEILLSGHLKKIGERKQKNTTSL